MPNNTSTSLTTGIQHPIPDSEDSLAISDFIEINKGKEIVAVQGLGFVGTVMSLVVTNSDDDNYAVIGLDKSTPESYWKIVDINQGNLPIVSSDPLVEKYYQNSRAKKNLLATYDSQAFAFADVIIVDINLDVTKIKDSQENIVSYDVPLDGFKKAMVLIGKYCKSDALILVETTVPPGTCRKIVYPIIKEQLNLRGLADDEFKLGHSYERVMPGPNYVNSIKNFYRVYSGIDERSADAVEKFLKTIISTEQYPLTRLKTTESTEMAKVLENSYRAMNISFIVEWSRFAEEAGVDLYEVVDAIRLRPTHANLMYPGIGVGGYCLTKDPLLASWASKEFFGINSGLGSSVAAVELNDKMPRYCYEYINNVFSKLGKQIKNIGLLGVAYGPGIGDTRFSPVEDLFKRLAKNNYNINCHDPYVKHWSEVDIHVETSMPAFFTIDFDCLIITTAHRNYIESGGVYDLLQGIKQEMVIIDTVGLLDVKKLPLRFIENKTFFVLGVGYPKEEI